MCKCCSGNFGHIQYSEHTEKHKENVVTLDNSTKEGGAQKFVHFAMYNVYLCSG